MLYMLLAYFTVAFRSSRCYLGATVSPPLRLQDGESTLEAVSASFTQHFQKTDQFKAGCAISTLLEDHLLTNTQARAVRQSPSFSRLGVCAPAARLCSLISRFSS